MTEGTLTLVAALCLPLLASGLDTEVEMARTASPQTSEIYRTSIIAAFATKSVLLQGVALQLESA